MSKKIYTIVSRGFCSSGACFWVLLIVMMLLGSCWDESLTTMHPGPEISFSLSDATVRPITRTGGDREDTDMVVVDSLLGVLPLQTEDGGRELYLHAFLSGSDRAGEGRVLTRAAPVDGMGFYDSFGVLPLCIPVHGMRVHVFRITCTMSWSRNPLPGQPLTTGPGAGATCVSSPTHLTIGRGSSYRGKTWRGPRQSPVRSRMMSRIKKTC